jgi:RNA polymerase sigma-B factor
MSVNSPARGTGEIDRELLRRYHEHGDPRARDELIQRHLPLVRSLARRYVNRGESLDDLEQVGAIGLIKAIDRFDVSRDVALTSYATPNILGEIKRHFRDRGSAIRVPRSLQELSMRASRAIERLTVKLGRSPSLSQVADELHESPELILEALEADSATSVVSLSPGAQRIGDLDPLETIGGEDANFSLTDDRAALEPVLERLPAREREILRLRFEGGLTQSQIAERIGVSQMHVSRLIRKSLARIRSALG